MSDPEMRNKVLKIENGRGYQSVYDLRSLGLPVSVSVNNQWQEHGNKMSFYETSKMTLGDMEHLYDEVFADRDFLARRILRVDLTADVRVPVPWFRRNVHVRRKGYLDYHEETYERHLSVRKAETAYAGKKPNQYRFYDKAAERWKFLKQRNNRLPLSERLSDHQLDCLFQEEYGRHPDETWTRVERQLGGYDPKKTGIHLVGDMSKLPDFYPFEAVEFLSGARHYEALEGLDVAWEHHVLAMQQMVHNDGLDFARAYIRKRINHRSNWLRHWRKLEPFLSGLCTEEIDHNTLRAVYVMGVNRQLQIAA